MAETRKKLVAITSPKIKFLFPDLVKPSYGSKEFPKPDGEYKVQGVLVADSPEAAAFIKQLTPHHEAAVEEGKAAYAKLPAQTRAKLEKQGGFKINDFYTEALDKETEEPTGDLIFKFAMGASGVIKNGPKTGQPWKRRPALFDRRGNPMIVTNKRGEVLPNAPDIWSGTIGRINCELAPYFITGTGTAGMKLALVGAQIIDMQSGGQRSAKSMGFGEEEGEFEAGNYAGSDEDEEETGNREAGDPGPSATDDF